MQNMRRIILLILLLLPAAVFATVFTPPPTDKSVEFLGNIFGTYIGSLYLGGAPNPALMRMFELFNVTIVTIGVIIVSYIGIVSTINTAQEGKTMGKKFASIWIPMRAVLGMMLLVPTPTSGYSVIQVSVMWLIMQGIGAADHVWNNILGNLTQGVAVSAGIKIDDKSTIQKTLLREGMILTENVLRSAVCIASMHKIAANPEQFKTDIDSKVRQLGKQIAYYTLPNTSRLQTDDSATVAGSFYVGVRGNEDYNDICGKFHVEGTAEKEDWPANDIVSRNDLLAKAQEIYDQKITALMLMYDTLAPLARAIVDETATPRDNNNRIKNLNDQPIQPEGYRDRSAKIYRNTMSLIAKPHRDETLDDIVREGVQSGWVSAGSFYFALNKTYKLEFFKDIIVPPSPEFIPRCDNENLCQSFLANRTQGLNEKLHKALEFDEEKNLLATRLWDAKSYLETDSASSIERLSVNKTPGVNPEMQRLEHQLTGDLAKLMQEQDLDPIIAQGKFGASIMATTENLWLDAMNKQQTLINRAKQQNPDSPATANLLKEIEGLTTSGAFFLSIYGIFWIVGATLAVYVPFIPYMMFAVGVLGWFLLVIEAIVAAPILALSFIMPSGEELGKIMQGLMLLFNILLRPTLMLFGFVLASLLYKVIVEFVNFGMISNFSNLDTSGSLFAWGAILVLYGAFIIALANKCFALIYGLPDKILRWMGGAPEHTDASQEMHQAKGTMGKGADTINKVSTGFGERGLGRLQERAKQLKPPADSVSSSKKDE